MGEKKNSRGLATDVVQGSDFHAPAPLTERRIANSNITARRHQRPAAAMLLQNRQCLVRGMPLGDAAKIELHIGDSERDRPGC